MYCTLKYRYTAILTGGEISTPRLQFKPPTSRSFSAEILLRLLLFLSSPLLLSSSSSSSRSSTKKYQKVHYMYMRRLVCT